MAAGGPEKPAEGAAAGDFTKTLCLDYNPPKTLVVKLAETKHEVAAALGLLHDTYVREGYMKPHPSGMRLTIYHALPSPSHRRPME